MRTHSASATMMKATSHIMAGPQTVIAAAETSAKTKNECVFTSLKLHQDVLTNSTMLHTWAVLQTKSIRVHYLTRCLGGSKIQRNVKWNVTRRDISILLGRGEANAFVVILYVSNEGEEWQAYISLSLSFSHFFLIFILCVLPYFLFRFRQINPHPGLR